MDVMSSLLPVLGLIGGIAAICLVIARLSRGKKRGTLRVDPVTNLFVDPEDRQEDD